MDYSQNHSLLFYYNLNNTIAAFNIEKKETIWETNIMNILGVSKSEKIEALHLTKVFGILKENLWLSFEFHYIIGLSIIDGEILFSFNINDLLPQKTNTAGSSPILMKMQARFLIVKAMPILC
ncbi:MAG: hypothetical protein IPL23_08040 [Saprospiraceae bacterium]|nr:hypothetical protein [Saprospiraceae bacterium]